MKVSGWLGTYPIGEVNVELTGSLAQGLMQSSHIPQSSICRESSLTSDEQTALILVDTFALGAAKGLFIIFKSLLAT